MLFPCFAICAEIEIPLGCHWILALLFTLLIFDAFFETELLAWIAILLSSVYLSAVACLNLNLPIQWSLLLFLCITILFLFAYYTIWKFCIKTVLTKILMSEASKESVMTAPGTTGKILVIESKPFVEWNGELWQIQHSPSEEFEHEELVLITAQKNGIFYVKKITN